MEATAVFDVAASRSPDSTHWSTASDSGIGRIGCVRQDGKSSCTDTILLQKELGADTLHLDLWSLGVRFATLDCRQVGRSPVLSFKIRYDTLDTLLLGRFLKLRQSKPDSLPNPSASDLANFYATLVLARAPEFAGYPTRTPGGIDRRKVEAALVWLGVRADKNWQELASLGLGLDSLSVLAAALELRRTGRLNPSDSLLLFPRYPLRIGRAATLADSIFAGGPAASISGSFSWTKGTKLLAPRSSIRTANGVDSIHFRFTIDRFIPEDSGWNLDGNLAIEADTGASPGQDTLVIELRDDKGHSVATRTPFRVVTKSDTAIAPSILPSGGTFTAPQSVTILSATSGAEIRYTLDGTEPSASSPLYGTPVLVGATATLRAIAFKSRSIPSSEAQAKFVFDTVARPVPDLAPGNYDRAKVVSIGCPTKDATIHFSTDGSDPTVSSPIYSTPISVHSNVAIRAIAFKKGMVESPTMTANYALLRRDSTLSELASNPGSFTTAFLGGSRSYVDSVPSGTTKIVLSAIPTAPDDIDSILFNGSTDSAISLEASDPTTVSVRLVNRNGNRMEYILRVFHKAPETPAFSPEGRTDTLEQTVRILCSSAGASIHYSLDGSMPDISSPLYREPILVNSSLTISAIAIGNGGVASAVSRASYRFDTAAAPSILPGGGAMVRRDSVRISCSTAGARIRYTTDGSNPTASSPLYTSPFVDSVTETVKAVAFKDGMRRSPVCSASFRFDTTHAATFDPPAGRFDSARTLTLASATKGARIYYSWEHDPATTSDSLYKSPIQLDSRRTIHTLVVKDSMVPSTSSGKYDFDTCQAPTFSTDPSTVPLIYYFPFPIPYNVTLYMSSATPDATIFYSVSNQGWTQGGSATFPGSGPTINIPSVKAYAHKEGWVNSPVSSR